MNRRPVVLSLIAAVLGFVAASLPVQIMMLYGHGPSEVMAILSKLTLLNWLVMIASAATAGLVLRASPWSRFAVPGLIALVGANNFFVGYYATDFSMATATLGTFAFAAFHAPLLNPKIRELFANPDKRWWLRTERKRVSVPVFIGGTREAALHAQTFDLSETGVFIPLASAQAAHGTTGAKDPHGLQIEERITIKLSLGMLSQIRCQARVVRRAEARGMYPAGIGIQFLDLSTTQRRELKRYLERQPEAMV